jgi:hypothetical protein
LHDENDGRRGCDGRDRVHGDAELAMVGVGFVRVKVRYLSDCEHRQQDQTENRHCRKKSGAGAASAAENCL